MTERQPTPKNEIIVGGIYIHLGNPLHRYQVLRTGLDDTSVYEETGQIRKLVEYRQLYDGDYPTGKVWYKREKNFLGNALVDGHEIPIFTFVEMGEPDTFSPSK